MVHATQPPNPRATSTSKQNTSTKRASVRSGPLRRGEPAAVPKPTRNVGMPGGFCCVPGAEPAAGLMTWFAGAEPVVGLMIWFPGAEPAAGLMTWFAGAEPVVGLMIWFPGAGLLGLIVAVPGCEPAVLAGTGPPARN